MLVLDLFCGAGLVADGLRAAGCTVVGVDLTPQPRYPGAFLQHDALTLDPRFLDLFDAIWASPPCLRHTSMKHAPGAKGDAHPDLITPTRDMLLRANKPYVIENVPGAELVSPMMLCGSMFGLGALIDGEFYHLQRHRNFETNWPLTPPVPNTCHHFTPVVGVYGGHARVRSAKHGGRKTADFVGHSHRQIMGRAMGIEDHRDITCSEISQGIPPIYARYVGRRLRGWVEGA